MKGVKNVVQLLVIDLRYAHGGGSPSSKVGLDEIAKNQEKIRLLSVPFLFRMQAIYLGAPNS